MPKVSVILSTYNRADHFLPRAIRSVLAQTLADLELYVVDDCSTDNTAAVVRGFTKEDARVHSLCTPQNSAYQCAPKNLGIRASVAPLIAYLDDDNEWHPHHLARLVEALEAAEADIAYAGRTYANDPAIPHPGPPYTGADLDHNLQPFEPDRLRFENYIDTSDLLHTRIAIQRIGGWDENCRRAADWNLVLRFAEAKFKFVAVPEVLTTYYWHGRMNIGHVPIGRPAIWTLTKNRLYYVQQAFIALWSTIGVAFDHYVLDQGSVDGTAEWLAEQYRQGRIAYLRLEPQNVGISRGSNHLLDIIRAGDFHTWIVKLDSDVVSMTPKWIERMAQRWLPKHVLSPHILGLEHHPGGAPRTTRDPLRRLGYAKHLGGACNLAPFEAWKEFGDWIVPAPAHGTQDAEFSQRLLDKGWKLAYCEDILARHLGNTPADVRAAERGVIV